MHARLALAALTLLGCSEAGATPGTPGATPRTLAIDATATLHLPPDTAAITLTFAAHDADLSVAHERVESSRAAFLAAAASLDARVETGVVQYAPYRPYSGAPETFRAAQTIEVHTADFEAIPSVIRLAGGGLSEVSVRYYVADLVQHRSRLRHMAIEAARAKAAELADGFEVSLGEVLAIEERGAQTHAFGVGNFDNRVVTVEAPDEGTPPPGAIPLRTTLRVTYALRGG